MGKMKWEQAFERDAKLKKFDSDTFPHAQSGLKAFFRVIKSGTILLVFAAIQLILRILKSAGVGAAIDKMFQGSINGGNSSSNALIEGLKTDWNYGKQLVTYVFSLFTTHPQSTNTVTSSAPPASSAAPASSNAVVVATVSAAKPTSGFDSLINGVTSITWVLFWIFVLFFAFYLIKVGQRHLAWETKIFESDWNSYRRTKTLKKETLNLNQKGKDLKKSINDSKNKGDKKKSRALTAKDKNAKEVIKVLKQSEWFVNVRKSLKSKELIEYQQVRFYTSRNKEVAKQIDGELKGIEEDLNLIVGEGYNFGKLETSANRAMMSSHASRNIEMKEPKRLSNPPALIGKNEPDTAWAFALELFEDRTEIAAQRTTEAKEWAKQTQSSLAVFFATTKAKFNFVDFDVFATKAVFRYDFVFDTTTPNISNWGKQIDNLLGTSGSMAVLKSGKLTIILVLPKGIPVDVKNLYEHAYSLAENFNNPTLAVLGTDVDGGILTTDIAKAPHIIVAGQTGSGKSVSVNQIVISLMAHNTPNKIKFAMVDPKKVEFAAYRDNPFLLVEPIIDMQYAYAFFEYMVWEMERRYELFATYAESHGIRNIIAYNNAVRNGKIAGEELPYIIAIVDETADLMMQTDGTVETPLIRMGQKARACGTHVIIATQRPSAEVITGLIKANFPTRLALKVDSQLNSSIILDTDGAEKLVGNGDSYFLDVTGKMTRVQSPYISDDDDNSTGGELGSILRSMKKDKRLMSMKTEPVDFVSKAVELGKVEWKQKDNSEEEVLVYKKKPRTR